MPGVTNNVLVEDDGWVRTLSSRTVVSCGNVFVYELETVDAIVLMSFQMRGEKIARHLLVSHRLAYPEKMNCQLGKQRCAISIYYNIYLMAPFRRCPRIHFRLRITMRPWLRHFTDRSWFLLSPLENDTPRARH